MRKHGKTPQGKTRWRCLLCKKTSIRKRKDVSRRKMEHTTQEWILNGKKLKHLAEETKKTVRQVRRDIAVFLESYIVPQHRKELDSTKPLIIDATWIIKRKTSVLVAHDEEVVIDWMFAVTENFTVWYMFLAQLEGTPCGVVSDAQKGLLQAITLRFPDIPHQRCLAHISRLSRAWLTQNPKTQAGKDLLDLVVHIHGIKTHKERDYWKTLFALSLIHI
jgi:hypothetical protein